MSKHSDSFIHSLFCGVKIASSRSRSLSAEEILVETCMDTLSDGASDMLSETDDDDDNVDSGSYGDFEPEIAMKVNKMAHHFRSDSEMRVLRNKTAMIKVRLCSWGGRNPTWQEQIIIPNLFF
jgi:hypothetical protein